MDKNLDQEYFESWVCNATQSMLEALIEERNNLYQIVRKLETEIEHLHKIQSLDIFHKLN